MNKVITVEAESVPQEGENAPRKEFDILEMPLEGVAAYWLSLKKLMDMKRNRRIFIEESEHTSERYIKLLLECAAQNMDDATTRMVAAARRQTLLTEYTRRFELIRIALVSMSSKENPRLALIRMLSLFPDDTVDEDKAIRMAQAMGKSLGEENADRKTLLAVDPSMSPDRLVVKLLYYGTLARREGPAGLRKILEYSTSRYFKEGLKLAMDGFETVLIEEFLSNMSEAILRDTERKMDMSVDLLQCIRAKMSYDAVYLVARGYMG